jgi:hypothetical protein
LKHEYVAEVRDTQRIGLVRDGIIAVDPPRAASSAGMIPAARALVEGGQSLDTMRSRR